MNRVVIAGLVVLTLAACGARKLTPEEKALVGSLQSELAEVRSEINAAEDRDRELVGGLVKALLQARVEVLKTNEALLQQRINAIQSGARITVELKAVEPNPDEANRLEAEIKAQEQLIASEREDARQYSGGLVLAMKMASIATQEQTLAMLKQRYLTAKYGLGLPAQGLKEENESVESSAARDAPARVQQPRTEIVLPAGDGPFGLEAGLGLTELKQIVGGALEPIEGKRHLYQVKRVPRPHSEFEAYVLQVGPSTGLCRVRGIGVDVASSRHGTQLQSAFNSMYEALQRVYGPGNKTSLLLPGTIWNEPEDFMMGLVKQERILSAEWKPAVGEEFKGHVSSMVLAAQASSGETGYLILEYEFANYEQCKEEAQAQESGAL